MAINQDKYIDINSSVGGDVLGERSLQGLVFTRTTVDDKFAANSIMEMTLSETLDTFGSESDEYKFAVKYFGYISPSGGTPDKITFANFGESEAPSAALVRVDKATNNFGCFTFLAGDIDADGLLAAAEANAGFDYRYLMVVPVTSSTYSDVVAKLGKTVGCHVVLGADKYAAYMPMAIASSVDYDKANATTTMMFKRFAGAVATVDTNELSDALDKLHVNYIGGTQTNGTKIAFYQRGFNLDGVDAMVYMNEVWLKASITTAFFNLLSTVERIPANSSGLGYINVAIAEAIENALNNGVIMPGKTFNSAQRVRIAQLTNSTEAYATIENQGYWSNIVLVNNGNDEYVAKYRIVYSKGDSIRKVEGTHNLV